MGYRKEKMKVDLVILRVLNIAQLATSTNTDSEMGIKKKFGGCPGGSGFECGLRLFMRIHLSIITSCFLRSACDIFKTKMRENAKSNTQHIWKTCQMSSTCCSVFKKHPNDTF